LFEKLIIWLFQIAKFFLSGQYKDQFKGAADNLVSRKADIQFACTLHSTVTIDELRNEVRATNTMILKLTSIIEFQSDREKSWEQTVNQYGGAKRILGSPDDLQAVANIIEGRNVAADSTTTPSSKVAAEASARGKPPGGGGADASKSKDGPPAPAATKPKLSKDEPSFSRKELLEIQQPLTAILRESREYYERKLDAQVQYLSTQIERSTQRILHRLDVGAYMKILDPDIRSIWKDNVCLRSLIGLI
jgi:hypothetical protein